MAIQFNSALIREYEQLFASCRILPQYLASVAQLIQQLHTHQTRYQTVEQTTGVPWMIIAVIHAMEANLSFNRHIHNGDPLHSRTKNAPAHRPLTAPPFTWEASAVDALHYSGLSAWRDWSTAGTLFKLEAYNGWGYRRYHPQVLSPYLWSFSEHYQRGNYAADGRFDANLVSQQCGAAVLLKQLNAFAVIPPTAATQANLHTTPTPLNNRPYPGQLLKRSGKQNSNVNHIQQRLNALGYLPALKIDSHFGPKTEQAVKWLQTNSQR